MVSQPGFLSQVMSLFTPLHRDGYKFFALSAIGTVLLFLLSTSLGVLGAVVTASIAFFFRDPDRISPVRDGLVLSPADGTVLRIAEMPAPAELRLGDGPLTCVSIFLSMFDVHVIRSAVPGRVAASVHRPGAYHHANSADAQTENERQSLAFELADGTSIGVVLIAGAVARRIVTYAKEADSLAAGERIGIIRFGSRVDVYMHGAQGILVSEGQRVTGGESVLADRALQESPRVFRRQ